MFTTKPYLIKMVVIGSMLGVQRPCLRWWRGNFFRGSLKGPMEGLVKAW